MWEWLIKLTNLKCIQLLNSWISTEMVLCLTKRTPGHSPCVLTIIVCCELCTCSLSAKDHPGETEQVLSSSNFGARWRRSNRILSFRILELHLTVGVRVRRTSTSMHARRKFHICANNTHMRANEHSPFHKYAIFLLWITTYILHSIENPSLFSPISVFPSRCIARWMSVCLLPESKMPTFETAPHT